MRGIRYRWCEGWEWVRPVIGWWQWREVAVIGCWSVAGEGAGFSHPSTPIKSREAADSPESSHWTAGWNLELSVSPQHLHWYWGGRMWPLSNSVLVMVVSQTCPGFWRMMGNVLQASSSILVSGINISQKSSPGCPVCTDRNIFKEITKKTIKEEILRKLGLSSPPTVNVTVSTVSELPYVQQQINEVSNWFK